MKYRFRHNAEDLDLEVTAEGDETLSVVIGEKRYGARVRRISPHQIHLTVDGRQMMAFVADTPEGKAVVVGGRSWLLADAAAPALARKNLRPVGPPTVTPPMPAVVTRILVAVGDSVEKGQAVVVVSAMKMDTTLTAPFDGEVTRVLVAEGDRVAPRQVLVDIAPAADTAAA